MTSSIDPADAQKPDWGTKYVGQDHCLEKTWHDPYTYPSQSGQGGEVEEILFLMETVRKAIIDADD